MGLLDNIFAGLFGPQYDINQTVNAVRPGSISSWEELHRKLDEGNKLDPELFGEDYVNKADAIWQAYQRNPNDPTAALNLYTLTQDLDSQIGTATTHKKNLEAVTGYEGYGTSAIQNLRRGTDSAFREAGSALDSVFGPGSSYNDLVELVRKNIDTPVYSDENILRKISTAKGSRGSQLKNEKRNIESDLAARGLTRSGVAASLTQQANTLASNDMAELASSIDTTLRGENEKSKEYYTGILSNLQGLESSARSGLAEMIPGIKTSTESLISQIEGDIGKAKLAGETTGLPDYSHADLYSGLGDVGKFTSDINFLNQQLFSNKSQENLDNIMNLISLGIASKKNKGGSSSSGGLSLSGGIPGLFSVGSTI